MERPSISPKVKPVSQSAVPVVASEHEVSTKATSEHEVSPEEFFSNESSQDMILSNDQAKTDENVHFQDETEGWEFDELEELKKESN